MRIEPPAPAQMSEQHRDLLKGIEKKYGYPLHSVAVMAHSPACLDATVGFEIQHARARSLPRRLQSLVNLTVALQLGCQFCLDIGTRDAMAAGVMPEEIAALHAFESSAAFTAEEKLALRYAEAMTHDPSAISDALFEQLRRTWSDEQIVEMSVIIAWENYRSRFNRALRLPAHGFVDESVRPRAEA